MRAPTPFRPTCLIVVGVLVLGPFTDTSSAQADLTQINLLQKIVSVNIARAENIPALEFRAEAKINFGKEFLEGNPSATPSDGAVTYYSGILSGDRYQISSFAWSEALGSTPTYVASFDGMMWNYLDPKGSSRLLVSKSFFTDPPSAMNLGSVLLVPFAFLFETKDPIALPFVTLKRLADKTLWEGAMKTSSNVGEDETGRPRFKFSFASGISYIVTFSPDYDFYPMRVEKFSPEGHLQVRYTVSTLKELDLSHGALSLPSSARLETFTSTGKYHLYSVEYTLTEIKVIAEPEAELFQSDPSAVDTIYDLDNQLLIQVPR